MIFEASQVHLDREASSISSAGGTATNDRTTTLDSRLALPQGSRDVLPTEARELHAIREVLLEAFGSYGDRIAAGHRRLALSELAALLAERRRDLPAGFYSAELFRKGRGAIAQKVGEEALELALAAVTETRERAVSELTGFRTRAQPERKPPQVHH